MLKAVIFDLDGVLIDSTKYIWRSFSEILNGKVVFTDDDIRMYLASSLRESVISWRERFGIEITDIEAFSRDAGEIEFALSEKDVKRNPSLIDFLEQLRAKGVKMGVGTSSMRWRAERILDLLSLTSYFSVLVTANDVENHKPNPEVFLSVAKQLNVDPGDCVVIEDAVNGIEAAHRGGMKVVGLVTQYHSAQELAAAERVITSFSELSVEALRELFD